jgi:hypothetical protein
VDVQVLDVLSPEQQVGVDGVAGRHEGKVRVALLLGLPALGPEALDVLQRHRGVLLVDAVQDPLVPDVLLGDEADPLAWGAGLGVCARGAIRARRGSSRTTRIIGGVVFSFRAKRRAMPRSRSEELK